MVIGVAAGIGLLVGFEPANLPPAILDIAVYKLTFAAALLLLGVGAMALRYGRRVDSREKSSETANVTKRELRDGEHYGRLPQGASELPPVSSREAEPTRRTRERAASTPRRPQHLDDRER